MRIPPAQGPYFAKSGHQIGGVDYTAHAQSFKSQRKRVSQDYAKTTATYKPESQNGQGRQNG